MSAAGGQPVGLLSDLPPVAAGAVVFLRLWDEGAAVRDALWAGLGAGGPAGRSALEAFQALSDLCRGHGRRPLLRHAIGCRCLGADEACFGRLVESAAEGSREDAMLIATLIVRPDMAPALAALAAEFGLALLRLNLAAPSAPRPAGTVLH